MNLQQAKNKVLFCGEANGVVVMQATNDNSLFYIDFEDFDRTKNHSWFADKQGYLVAKINKRPTFLHRFIKNPANGFCIDHANGDKFDNRKRNLRECTKIQNSLNRGKNKNNKSGFKGVHYHHAAKKFRAQIVVVIGGVRTRLRQCFTCPILAARQYDIWAREHHGEFARLNNV